MAIGPAGSRRRGDVPETARWRVDGEGPGESNGIVESRPRSISRIPPRIGRRREGVRLRGVGTEGDDRVEGSFPPPSGSDNDLPASSASVIPGRRAASASPRRGRRDEPSARSGRFRPRPSSSASPHQSATGSEPLPQSRFERTPAAREISSPPGQDGGERTAGRRRGRRRHPFTRISAPGRRDRPHGPLFHKTEIVRRTAARGKIRHQADSPRKPER